MNSRERDALDRHITGNYGEDQMDQDFERLFEAAQEMHDLVQQWRETGKPVLGRLSEAHDKLGEALKKYDA